MKYLDKKVGITMEISSAPYSFGGVPIPNGILIKNNDNGSYDID